MMGFHPVSSVNGYRAPGGVHMPELPEVECVRRTLEPSVLNRRVSRVRVEKPKLARPAPEVFRKGLTGRTITATSRHGKLLILHLDGDGFWAIHLGMTGQVISAQQRPRVNHIHITVSFKDQGPKLYYRDMRQFGYMAYCPDHAALEAGPLANFGPDALGLDLEAFISGLGRRSAPLKSLLLDQRILAGIGNIYADESLHRAGLSPLAKPADLNRAKLTTLHSAIQETLAEALAKGGSSVRNFVDAEGRAGTFQEAHRVYRRTGCECPRCGNSIQRIVLGGRSTHFCPECQLER
jgi:formamidopyrimidine-DNA glycosylase